MLIIYYLPAWPQERNKMGKSKQPSRPLAFVPLDDIWGLRTLVDKGWTQEQMAEYYSVGRSTISRRLKEMREEE